MSEILNKFSVDAVKFSGQVMVCFIMIWMMVVACAIMSVVQQPFERRQRIFWIALIVCLPGVGLLAYLPFSLPKERQAVWFKKKK